MQIHWETVADVCHRNDIDELLVFGSVARGEDTASSDVDLIARFSARKSLLDIIRIERELCEALGRKVDLLTEGAISPHLIKQIMRDARVVFERAA